MTSERITAEEAVIGGMVVDSSFCIPKLKGILNPEHFKNYELSQIYEMILKMSNENSSIDFITVSSKISDSFVPKLIKIISALPGVSNIEVYRDYVIRHYHERRLKGHMKKDVERMDHESIKGIQDEWNSIEQLGSRKFDLTKKLLNYADVLDNRAKGGETHYPTGIKGIDETFHSAAIFKRGEMCVLGARTSLGKTALMLSIMLNMAKSGLRVMFCSGEMSLNQLLDRIVAIETKVPLWQIRSGKLDNQWPRITTALESLSGMNISFVESSKLTLSRIIPQLNEFKPDVLFVDYAQRFSLDGHTNNRAAFFSDVANELKGIAINKNILVFVASQLGRGVEQRQDEPRLSDLKESGGLEEAADVVWMLHMDSAEFGKEDKAYKMLILKNRNGPTFSFNSVFHNKTATFSDN